MLKKMIICAGLSLAAFANADITIGQSVPISGVSSETGKGLALGASIYFNKINGNGGVNGQKINHVVRDDNYDPKRTVRNTQELIDKENALALISFYGSANMAELIKSKVLENAGIPLVGVHSGAEDIRNPGSAYLFHTRASYVQEIERVVKLLADNLGVTKFAVMAQQDAFGEAGLAAAKASLKKRNLTLLGEAWYDKKTSDTSKAARDLAKLNPDAIIIVAVSKPAATFTQQFKENGGTSQLYALSPVQFEEVNRAIGKKGAHGLGISQVFPYPLNTRFRLIQEFQTDISNELGASTVGNQALNSALSQYSSYAMLEGYVSAKIIVDAIKIAGKDPTRASIYKALMTMNRHDLGGFIIDYNETKRTGSNYGEVTMMSPTGVLTR